MILARDVCLKEVMYTLKDFKNAKTEIHKVFYF